ncbi:dNTP triphosphohydrolase [Maribacter sp. PR1]|uniref:DNTP triphosphohydrolase n=1 Tax=Maribacter cobaltidurans TaxID=1178778 RepID=A0ABU7IUJ2_9FLAO|nr:MULTISPECIES: dNTP triphosphohydrolase [Maribacter]MDC6388812.1 dNTP triphosphohydrolase [Maribacter sp. PR1]MEE1976201.1 dNTP triphosphohydrolase [Maribacter cobaltidurans]
MDLNKLYSSQRTGVDQPEDNDDPRSGYQKDYDRIIFSSAFRRLQNKTQVFPLPGSVFVHNRLTHSLEVSSVGRSLGSLVGKYIYDIYANDLDSKSKPFYRNHLKNVLSSACLCHDIGNPAFGHSGEDAMVSFFKKNEKELKSRFSDKEYSDLTNFEGNANSIRVLTQQLNGKPKGGLRLTYSTLAAIAKYPCESTARNNDFTHRKKFGFLQSEKETFEKVALETGMIIDTSVSGLSYLRHPFVWLVEAADDICYYIIDLEDAQRLRIIETSHCEGLLDNLIRCLGVEDVSEFDKTLITISDKNERISYLRAKSINSLIFKAFEFYKLHFDNIVAGKHNKALFDMIAEDCNALQQIVDFSVEHIYNDRSVVEIENAGYNVMYELLNHFVYPILKEKKEKSDKKALILIPKQYRTESESNYDKVMGIVDYLSGMTDIYATELYRKIKGIEIGMRN